MMIINALRRTTHRIKIPTSISQRFFTISSEKPREDINDETIAKKQIEIDKHKVTGWNGLDHDQIDSSDIIGRGKTMMETEFEAARAVRSGDPTQTYYTTPVQNDNSATKVSF
jgi:hypothetical protein